MAGLGLIVLPHWMIHTQLESGKLELVMQDFTPPPLPIQAVFPQQRHLPLKVCCFVEFLGEQFAENPILIYELVSHIHLYIVPGGRP